MVANIEKLAKTAYDFTHFTHVLSNSIYVVCCHNYVGINRCVFYLVEADFADAIPASKEYKISLFF